MRQQDRVTLQRGAIVQVHLHDHQWADVVGALRSADAPISDRDVAVLADVVGSAIDDQVGGITTVTADAHRVTSNRARSQRSTAGTPADRPSGLPATVR